MTEEHYKLGHGVDAVAVAAALQPLGEVRVEHTRTVERIFLDSFDWRLFRAGLYLEETHDHETTISECRLLEDERRVAAYAGSVPRFAEQLPFGPLRDTLQPLLKMRALLPVVRLKSAVTELRLLDGREKTTVRLQMRSEEVLNHIPSQNLPPRLHLIPLRGFEKEATLARRQIKSVLKLKPSKQHPLEKALAVAGRKPVDYTSGLRLTLDAAMPASQAMHTILAYLFQMMGKNKQGLIEDLDSEFLHDFRVAVRRTRTALAQLKPGISDADRWRLQPEFHWLGDITTPVRDLDVWLLKFETCQAVLPEAMRDDLLPLREIIQHERNRAHRSLVRQLQSEQYARLQRQVLLVLEHLEEDAARSHDLSAKAMADKRIGKLYRRVVRQGEALGKKSPPEAWHELRKSCKKLRYLLEFFRSLYPDAAIKRQIRSLKQLQDNLGAVQDTRVQLQMLGEWRRHLEQKGATDGTLAAIDWLADDIRHIGNEERKGFGACFAAFAAKKRRKQMQEMLKG